MYIYKRLILPVVLYYCQTWSHTLNEIHGLKAAESRELRRIRISTEEIIMRSLNNYVLPSN
jgi:hypothetical protein